MWYVTYAQQIMRLFGSTIWLIKIHSLSLMGPTSAFESEGSQNLQILTVQKWLKIWTKFATEQALYLYICIYFKFKKLLIISWKIIFLVLNFQKDASWTLVYYLIVVDLPNYVSCFKFFVAKSATKSAKINAFGASGRVNENFERSLLHYSWQPQCRSHCHLKMEDILILMP